MKKQIPNIILIILLAIISVLVIYANGSVIAPNEDGKADDGGGKPATPENPLVPPKDDDIEEIKYPILSNIDNTYNFNQEIKTVDKYYGFVTFHQITLIFYDFNGGLKISAIDEKLNILTEKVISKNAVYLASKITIDGVAIVYNSEGKTILSTVDKSLNILNTMSFDISKEGAIYSFTESYMLILDTRIYVLRENKILNQTTSDTKTTAVLNDVNGYIFISTSANGYFIKKLSFNLDVILSVDYKNCTLLDYAMILDGGTSYFVIAEKINDSILIKKLNKSFDIVDEVSLGKGNNAKFSLLKDTLAVTVIGESSKIYLIRYNLDFKMAEQLEDALSIISTQIYKDNLFMMIDTSENFALYSYSEKGFTKKYLFDKGNEITFFINVNQTISIIRFIDNTLKMINLNI